LITLLLSKHGTQSVGIFLALLEKLLGDDDGNLVDERIVGEQVGLSIKHIDTLIERSLVCDCELFSGLNLSFDLVFKLGHVQHELIDLGGPHRKLFTLQVLSEHSFFLVNSLSAHFVASISQRSEDCLQSFSIDGVPCICGNSLLLLLSFVVHRPELPTNSIVEESLFHLKESSEAADVLPLLSLEFCGHSLLFFHGLDELINVSLFLVEINLIVGLIIGNVTYFHKVVFLQQLRLELLEEDVVGLFEGLNMLVIVGKRNLLPDDREVRASSNL
jgi:hypothetical protein